MHPRNSSSSAATRKSKPSVPISCLFIVHLKSASVLCLREAYHRVHSPHVHQEGVCVHAAYFGSADFVLVLELHQSPRTKHQSFRSDLRRQKGRITLRGLR